MPLKAGARLGPYEIVAPIGAGGMGEVFRARDTRLDRSVAIKVLPSHLSSNPQLRERFDREARAISALNHPNICTLHDVGHQDGTDYIVMELLEGESLADRLLRGPLPTAEVLKYGMHIAAALDRAHRQGVTHRDLKPGNIVITKSGAKLLDFGLAKMSSATVLAEAPTEHQPPLTAEGTIVGTFQYMAPEQLEGLEADARTDIFAFGAVLYEMVTGRRAFEGRTRTSLIAAIVDREPAPISSLQPLAPAALERVIRTCLAKDPDERWQSAHDVLLQLRALAEGGTQEHVAATPARRRRWREIVAWSVAALASGIAAVIGFRSLSSDAPPYYASIDAPAGVSMIVGGPNAGSITVSPDSRYMTFVAAEPDGVPRIWVRELTTRKVQSLAGTEKGEYPFWSPDSRQIAFFANRKLKTIPVAGGAAVDVCDVRESRGGSWGRDGTIVFTPHWRDPIYKVPATGGKPVRLTALNGSRNESTHRWPLFLPDGKHFLYFAGSHTADLTSGDNAIYLSSIDGAPPKLLLHARSNVIYAAGHLLFLRGQTLVAQQFDADARKLEGEPVPLVDGVRYEKGFFQAVFAASDRVLLYQGGGSETRSLLNWVDRTGKFVGTLGDKDVYFAAELSPDGRLAAAGIGDPTDLWIFDLERGVRTRLTSDSWGAYAAVFSADSKSLFYDSDRDVQVDTFRKTIGSVTEILFAGDRNVHERPLHASPDGRLIAMAHERVDGTNKSDIWLHPSADGAKPYPFIEGPFDEWDARFSPDGKAMAFVSDESGRDEVYVASLARPGEKWVVSASGGTSPRWRRDGKELFYIARNGAVTSVPILSLDPFKSGAATALFNVPIVSAPEPFYDVDAAGQKFLLNQPESVDEEPLTFVLNWTSSLRPKP